MLNDGKHMKIAMVHNFPTVVHPIQKKRLMFFFSLVEKTCSITMAGKFQTIHMNRVRFFLFHEITTS